MTDMAQVHRAIMRVAGLTVGFPWRYAYTRALCADHLCSDGANAPDSTDIELTVSDAMLAAERTKYEADYPERGHPQEGYVESLALQRTFAEAIIPHGRYLMHSAAVAVGGEAYAFLAPSGVGKSTHVAQWKAVLGDRVTVINGDKPIYGFEGDTLLVHGTPWRGKENWGIPGTAPVRALCILERGEENRIVRLTPSEALTGLMRQLYMPDDPALVPLCLSAADRILRTVPIYRLQCTPTPEAALLAYHEMSTARGENA